MTAKLPESLTPSASLRAKIEELSGEKITACYQCEKCTNGCPVNFAMDIAPHKLMRLVNLGQIEPLLSSDTIWVCASCETCTTRCPNNIDIHHVIDTLRQLSVKEGKVSQKSTPLFHKQFLDSARKYGRVHELSMIGFYTLKNEGIPGLLRQSKMGLQMLRKGKFKLLPHATRGKAEVAKIFRQAGGNGHD